VRRYDKESRRKEDSYIWWDDSIYWHPSWLGFTQSVS
jgi:hypothetical protein